MNIFASTMEQIAFLMGIMAIGYILSKLNLVPKNSHNVLSKLENYVFMPALVLSTFINNFTVEKLSQAGKLIVISFIVLLVVIPFTIVVSKLTTKDKYIQKIYIYGLSFSNFAFMGNAIMENMFPDIFLDYLIFTLPLWILIYLWGVPKLLIGDENGGKSIKDTLKTLVNPMFVAMLIGMVIGITGIKLPNFVMKAVGSMGSCMSPVAMLLSGMIISEISLRKTFTNVRTYVISVVRLIAIPLIFIGLAKFIPFEKSVYICTLCTLAMPLGLNTVVIPSAYDKDTSDAAGLALVSHILACITIPVIFSVI